MFRRALIAVVLAVGMLCPAVAQVQNAEPEFVVVRADHLRILVQEYERLQVIAKSKGCV